MHPDAQYIIFSRWQYISHSVFLQLVSAGVFVFGGEIWHFQIPRWKNLAEAQRLILTTQYRWSVPLKYVSDILQTEEAFTVEEYKHTHTQAVITWFKSIENKRSSLFMTFSIVDFYLSISKELLTESINYAKSITTIEEEVINTVFHARKSLLFDKTSIWVKKDSSHFDMTMGSCDWAGVCELVGLYLLNLLTNEYGKNNIGWYRDDCLSCFQNISGPDSEKIKKKICKTFKENRLNITVACNLAITYFLDVTFDLKSGTYYAYRKPKNKILYIHKQSNHPPFIIK